MTDHKRPGLPPEIEGVIASVLEAARLDMLRGRQEVVRELRAHFEDGMAAGSSPEELIERFGDPIAAGRRIAKTMPRAAARSRGEPGRWWMSAGEWLRELVRATRRLRRAPGFAAIVVLTLGLGVGANTAIFTVLNAVLLEDLPYADPDRLVRVYEATDEDPQAAWYLRAPMVTEYRRWNEVFESIGALYTYREEGADLTDGDVPRRVTVMSVSAGYFETLGVPPLRGRTFLEEESYGAGEAGGSSDVIAAVAIISHGLWAGYFGSDPDIIGRTVRLDDESFEIVGVMPDRFTDPFGSRAQLWLPQDMRFGDSNDFGNFYLSAVARLQEGVSIESARERVRILAAAFGETEPGAAGYVPQLEPLQADVVGATRATMLWILGAASILVLLAACLNVANLLLARGLSQDRPLALQSALGAGRGRLLAAILTENGLLAVLGGLSGLGIGWLGLQALTQLAPNALPGVADVGMRTPVFVFALAITVTALVVFGFLPALRLSRTSPADVLRAGDRSSTAGRLARRMRDGLVIIQVAVALVLVTGATLLSRSFSRLVDVPLVVEAEGVLTYEVHLPTARYATGAARHAFHEQLHDRVEALPGVDNASAVSWLPVDGRYHIWGFTWDESPDDANQPDFIGSDVRIIAGDYFQSLGIEVVRGALPSEIDYEGEDVVWINQAIADQVFGEVDPIGQHMSVNGLRRVVGVVENTPHDVRGQTSFKVYMPHAQYSEDRNWALIQIARARGDLPNVLESIRAEVAALDGQLVLHRAESFGDMLSEARAQDRFATVLMAAFAALALLLSLLGTYGVLAGSVAARTREFGIRMALGADASRVRQIVLRYATAITVPGILLGLLGAWISSRWIEALLYDVEPTSMSAYAVAIGIFLGVGLFSGWLPAERATRVDTVQTLSAE